MTQTDILIWGIILGIGLCWIGYKYIRRKKIQRMLKKAKSAEKRAIGLLEKKGYRVIDMQRRDIVRTKIDGNIHESTIRADFLVRKGFWKYIVEVKTGEQNKATLPNVRRQMMEYYLVYQPHGVILLDMEREKMKTVKFSCAATTAQVRCKLLLFTIIGFVLGYGCMLIGR